MRRGFPQGGDAADHGILPESGLSTVLAQGAHGSMQAVHGLASTTAPLGILGWEHGPVSAMRAFAPKGVVLIPGRLC
jgi:hypothetical protein